jgi:hypothetical protein
MRAPMARSPTTEMMAIVIFTPRGMPLLVSVLFWSLLDGSELDNMEGLVLVEYVVFGIELCNGTDVAVVVFEVVGFVESIFSVAIDDDILDVLVTEESSVLSTPLVLWQSLSFPLIDSESHM